MGLQPTILAILSLLIQTIEAASQKVGKRPVEERHFRAQVAKMLSEFLHTALD